MAKRIILENPAALFTLSNEDLEQFYWETDEQEKELGLRAEELKAQRTEIKAEFAARVKKAKRDGGIFGKSAVKLFTKVYTNKVTIDTARSLGAVKVEEKVDGAKIGQLVKSGAKVEGAEEREEIRVTKIVEAEE